jgi:hypothetical protein
MPWLRSGRRKEAWHGQRDRNGTLKWVYETAGKLIRLIPVVLLIRDDQLTK